MKSTLNLNKAINFAAYAHKGQVRKGSGIPYIIHPFAVGMILQHQGYPKEFVIAGILHDTLEDTMITYEDIQTHFGEYVAYLVSGCSNLEKHLPWEEKKQKSLDRLKNATLDIRIVACADKFHNLTSIMDDYELFQDEIWKNFKRGREKQKWYYTGLVDSFFYNDDIPNTATIFKDFEKIVNQFFI